MGPGPVAGVELLHPHESGKGARNLDRRSPPDHSVVQLIQVNSPGVIPCRTQRGTRALLSQKAGTLTNGPPVLPAAPAPSVHRKHSPAASAIRPTQAASSRVVSECRE